MHRVAAAVHLKVCYCQARTSQGFQSKIYLAEANDFRPDIVVHGNRNLMGNDEQAIRNLVQTWLAASKAGDLETVLKLIADDVVFMVPGQEPFGKEQFAETSKQMKGVPIEGISDIQEVKVLGDWAWLRNRLRVTISPPNGKPVVRSGYTLTILRKQPDGNWVIARDANLLMPVTTG